MEPKKKIGHILSLLRKSSKKMNHKSWQNMQHMGLTRGKIRKFQDIIPPQRYLLLTKAEVNLGEPSGAPRQGQPSVVIMTEVPANKCHAAS